MRCLKLMQKNMACKMIKKFKIFESLYHINNILDELVEQFDNEFVDEFWEDNFKESAREIINLWPNTIWRHIDDDSYISDLIDSEISSFSIEDFSDYDFRKYLEDNTTKKQEKTILKLYNKKQLKKGNDIENYYDNYMLDELSEKQLRKLIEDADDEEKFVEFIIRDRYEGQDAQEVIEEIYGSSWILDNGDDLYNMLYQYIDEDNIVEEYENEVDKLEEIKEYIDNSKELQEKLIEIKKSNVLLLAEVFKENNNGYYNIANEYDFQKLFIEMYAKKNKGDKNNLKAEALKFLYDNFELDEDIKDEYEDHMWLISSGKYNL